MPGRETYHHGNLRAELIEAALAEARESGPQAIGLRSITRKLRVSPNAAYRHFDDRNALILAVAAEIQNKMVEEMRSRMPAPDGRTAREKARSRLRAVGLGYIAFARSEPGWFALAFFGARDVPGPPLESADGGTPPPFALLTETLDELVTAGGLAPERRHGAEWACWSAVHGFAELANFGPLASHDESHVTALAERVVDDIISGIG
ncbi:TetR/AcrR family transcriptional regulator [Paramicrobacterium agarici]|uniref:TetR/AcrR family transcriptional regulator n=1 Tax=Paramicrobacterium agarici TaxID=630514 RepID=UPI00116B2B2F|nr:TetR/AcrR family transcriptional regulator [Microbacterium agarici]TQO23207.1 TetR family transcriptional regulator [Microbacterium agarici]